MKTAKDLVTLEDGDFIEISEQLDINYIDYRQEKLKALSDLSISGSAFNKDEVIQVKIDIKLSLEQHCRRCLKTITTQVDDHEVFEFDPNMKLDIASEGKVSRFKYTEKQGIDLLGIVKNFVRLALNPFPLCRADCKGLCPNCGENLNEHPDHDCSGTEQDGKAKDPRLEKLTQLL